MFEDLPPEKKANGTAEDLEITDLTSVLETFRKLTPSGRMRLLSTISTFFGIETRSAHQEIRLDSGLPIGRQPTSTFSTTRDLSPKEFVLQKQPQTSVERVACLAYYLTHYRDSPQFKTLDISKLNTEAAQPKFPNAALAVNDAAKTGYLIPTAKGNKQLSAAGELFVQALPDRDAARQAMATARPRRKARRMPIGLSRKASVEGDDSVE